MAVTPIRLEPFGRYGRLIANQANKARSYSPDRRSRPPDPLRRSKRPARISPSGRVIFLHSPFQFDAVALAPLENEKEGANQCVFWLQPDRAVSSKLPVHPPDETIAQSQSVTCFGISMTQWLSTPALEEVARKWRALVERRRAHFVELYQSGRWKRYYSEEQFLDHLREAIRASERWAEIAPSPARAGSVEEARSGADLRRRTAA
jgi:hypothetical protein